MDIKKVQKELNHAALGPLVVDGVLGPKTITAIKEFQQLHNIKADGKIGPETIAALFPLDKVPPVDKYQVKPWNTQKTALNLRALDILRAQVGIREKSNNSGPAVDAFLASVGLGPGFSWCMAFVYWGFAQAAKELGTINPLVRTGGCLKQWNETQSIKTHKPQSGDIFIMKIGNDGSGHTGMVLSVEGENINTVEGNTNDNGSANGDGVYFRSRKIDRILGFIRC